MSQRKKGGSDGRDQAHDDSDLADLLGRNGQGTRRSSGHAPHVKNIDDADDLDEKIPLVNDDKSNGSRKQHAPLRRVTSSTGFSYYPEEASCMTYCTAYMSLICFYHPWFCSTLAIGVGLCFLMLIVNLVFNPVQEYGIIAHDHSNIRSAYDIDIAQVDHWCLGGGNKDCLCEDPLTPSSQLNREAWVQAFRGNMKLVREFEDPLRGSELDVAFLGSSLVEEMSGRWLGEKVVALGRIQSLFTERFKRSAGNTGVEGVALGIAGDTAPNILYRLMHGELTPNFNPKVWWVVMGMDDLSRMKCSEEVVVIGILRVVEEILEKKPLARVVINSLLPMQYSRGGQYALLHDFEDSVGATERSKRITGKDEKDGWRRQLQDPLDLPLDNNPGQGLRWKPAGQEGDRGPRARPGSLDGRQDQNDKESDRGRNRWPGRGQGKTFDKESFVRGIEGPLSDRGIEEEKRLEILARQREGRLPRHQEDALLDVNRHKQRKYNPLSGFTRRKKKVPLWSSIYAINMQLKKFADKNSDRVEFFDSTSYFASKSENNKYHLQSSRISDRGHPTAEGYRVWENSVLHKLESILKSLKDEHPELFSPLDLDTDDEKKTELRPDMQPEPRTFAFDYDDGAYPDLYMSEIGLIGNAEPPYDHTVGGYVGGGKSEGTVNEQHQDTAQWKKDKNDGTGEGSEEVKSKKETPKSNDEDKDDDTADDEDDDTGDEEKESKSSNDAAESENKDDDVADDEEEAKSKKDSAQSNDEGGTSDNKEEPEKKENSAESNNGDERVDTTGSGDEDEENKKSEEGGNKKPEADEGEEGGDKGADSEGESNANSENDEDKGEDAGDSGDKKDSQTSAEDTDKEDKSDGEGKEGENESEKEGGGDSEKEDRADNENEKAAGNEGENESEKEGGGDSEKEDRADNENEKAEGKEGENESEKNESEKEGDGDSDKEDSANKEDGKAAGEEGDSLPKVDDRDSEKDDSEKEKRANEEGGERSDKEDESESKEEDGGGDANKEDNAQDEDEKTSSEKGENKEGGDEGGDEGTRFL